MFHLFTVIVQPTTVIGYADSYYRSMSVSINCGISKHEIIKKRGESMRKSMWIQALLAVATTILLVSNGAVAENEQSDDTDTALLDNMVVLGDKAGRDIQELPVSTSIIDQARIDDEPILNIDGVLNRVANVNSEGNAQLGAFSIRGVNNNALFASFNQSNVLATVFTNQVPLGGNTSDYLKPSTWDVSSVEVLRGPQSTLQGPNSLIGAIFFNYSRPNFSTEGRIRAEYGELDTLNIGAYQNIPLVDNVLAGRISVETRNSDGGLESSFTGADDVARIEERMARAQLLYQPFGDEDTHFNLTLMLNDSDTSVQAFATAFGEFTLEDRKNQENILPDYPSETILTSLESQIALNDNWDVRAVTGYTDLDVGEFLYDGDALPVDILRITGNLQEEIFSQDLRLHYTGTRLRGLIGGYYSSAELSSFYDSAGFLPGFGSFSAIFDLAEEVTTMAIYTNVDYDIFSRLTVNGGLRYNYEDRDNQNKSTSNGLFAELGGEDDFAQVLPSASFTYRFTDEINGGLKYARGYRSGGISVAPFIQLSQAFDEEFTDNYELFFRSQFMDRRLTINGNIFYVEWEDQQVPVLPPGGVPQFDELIVNAGESTLKGFEVEATLEVTTDLSIFTAIGYTDSEFKDFVFRGIDLSGNRLPNSPEWTISIGANYSHISGFFAGANYRWVDEAYTTIGAVEETTMSERNIVDAKIGFRTEHWSAYLWGTNLLDDFYETYLYDARIFGVDAYGSVSTPRRVGIGMEFYW